MTKPHNERRSGRRIPLTFHVEVSGMGYNGVPYCDHAAACDVSERGCQIHLAREIKGGDVLTLRIIRKERPAAEQQTPYLYRVMWVEPNKGGWLAGLAALEPGHPWPVNFPHEKTLVRG